MKLADYLAKPSGLSLAEHTANVERHGAELRDNFPFLARKYRELTGGSDLEQLCRLSEHYHDFGKALHPWQQACRRDYRMYGDWLKKQGIDPGRATADDHQRYECQRVRMEKSTAPHLRKAGFRHEFGSVAWISVHRPDFPRECLAAIAAHHGKLSLGEYAERRWREDGQQLKNPDLKAAVWRNYDELRSLYRNRSSRAEFAELVRLRYRYAAVRTLLQLADTRASAWEQVGDSGMEPVALHRFALKQVFEELRPVQEAAVAHSDRSRLILRAPTGSGKTHACVRWADEQVRAGRADRLVIAMPTRFTSNALHKSLREQVAAPGLYHSSAFYSLYGEEGDRHFASPEMARQKLARLLIRPTTVCTIDHLLASLTGTREDHYATFYFLANSCVVFDEVDFYDDFIQQNLRELLDVLDILRVPTLIMSATVPDSAAKFYACPEGIVEVGQPGSERVDKRLFSAGPAERAEDAAAILDRMIASGSGIVYANTVARALDYYRYLTERAGDLPVVLYHSVFTEPDKKNREEELEALLGKGANAGRGIAVLTQIGEMSVNISSNLMLTDCCPWDRLAQRVGRLARFVPEDERVRAEVHVVYPQLKGQDFPLPYGEIDRTSRPWSYPALPAYARTREDIERLAHEEGYRLTPAALVQLTNALYPTFEQPTTAAVNNRKELHDLIRRNWLLTGAVAISDDEGTISSWRSRNIDPQATVVVEAPPGDSFGSYGAAQDFVNRYGVSIRVSKAQQYCRDRPDDPDWTPCLRARKYFIGPPRTDGRDRHDILLYVAEPGAYRSDTGLSAVYNQPWTPDQQL